MSITIPPVELGGMTLYGGGTLSLGHINPLATGGLVRARQGGTLAQIAEAGRDEAVVPLGDSRATAALQAAMGVQDQSAKLDVLIDLMRQLVAGSGRSSSGDVRLSTGQLVGALDNAWGRGFA
jgi:hypothetical protein